MKGRRVADMAEIPPKAPGSCAATAASPIPRPCPEGSRIVEGDWWPADYRGPPLVSLDVEAARAAGLKVGDTLTVSILGREIEARIASLREINWDTMGFNFVIVFAPGHARERAAQLHGDDLDARGAGAPVRPRRLAAPSRASPRSGSRRWSRRSAGCSRSSRSRSAPPPRSRSWPASRCWSARSPPRAGPATYDSVILKLLGATRARILAAQAARVRGSGADRQPRRASRSARRPAGMWWSSASSSTGRPTGARLRATLALGRAGHPCARPARLPAGAGGAAGESACERFNPSLRT